MNTLKILEHIRREMKKVEDIEGDIPKSVGELDFHVGKVAGLIDFAVEMEREKKDAIEQFGKGLENLLKDMENDLEKDKRRVKVNIIEK